MCVIKCTCPNSIWGTTVLSFPRGWESVLHLRPDEWFDDVLINAMPGLMEAPADSRTFLLSSFLYGRRVKNGNFAEAHKWVKKVLWDHSRWVFAICEASHWVAVVIDWEGTSILYYDPWEEVNHNSVHRRSTLEVGFMPNNSGSPR
jgi:Ulp1 family protease